MLSFVLIAALSAAPRAGAAGRDSDRTPSRPALGVERGPRTERSVVEPIPQTEGFDLELKDIPKIVELPMPAAETLAQTPPPARSSRARGSRIVAPNAALAAKSSAANASAGAEASQAAVDLFSRWIGDAALKPGYADFEDGTRLHFAFREGTGAAVLVIHGRGLGPEGFQRWGKDMFPGRPVLFLQRRGYSEEREHLHQDQVYERNAADVEKAIALARRLSNGGKVSIVTHSLGAMVLPNLDPAKVAWLALLDPGVYGMFNSVELIPKNFFEPWMRGDIGGMMTMWLKQVQRLTENAQNMFAGEMATILAGGEWMTRWADPASRAGWIQSASNVILSGIEQRLDLMRRDDGSLADSLSSMLRRRERSEFWKEAMVEESLWAASARIKYAPWGSKIPVFLGTNDSDELIPQFVWGRLREQLGGNGRFFVALRQAGSHLHPLFFPQPWLTPLHRFDEEVQRLSAGNQIR